MKTGKSELATLRNPQCGIGSVARKNGGARGIGGVMAIVWTTCYGRGFFMPVIRRGFAGK